MDPELELPRMQDTLDRMVTTAKTAMLNNIEDDPEWEKHTHLNAEAALQLLNDALKPQLRNYSREVFQQTTK